MHLAIGLLAAAGLAFLLAEFFVVFLLPRRVKRDPRIARAVLRSLWLPWRAIAGRLPSAAADTMLGIYGPFSLLAILGMLSGGVILCYAGLHWATSLQLGGPPAADFGSGLYFSAATFFSASTPSTPVGGPGKVLQVAEAATGFAFLAIAIGYLPALFQAFSRREAAVSRLDPRAGSPPSPAALLERSGRSGGWTELDQYLREWETWTAELMETHLSYPTLAYFRSQHVNQNWLAALTTVVDSCAFALAYGPEDAIEHAELTFRIGRHALADLGYVTIPRRAQPPRNVDGRERLPTDALDELLGRLEGSGLHVEHNEEALERLTKLRSTYEPYALAIAHQLALKLADWVPEEVHENWRTALSVQRGQRVLP